MHDRGSSIIYRKEKTMYPKESCSTLVERLLKDMNNMRFFYCDEFPRYDQEKCKDENMKCCNLCFSMQSTKGGDMIALEE